MKISRNDACPCGSGKKYKHCCMGKTASMPVSQKLLLLVLVLMLTGGLVVAVYTLGDAEPSGRVWSEEHGHWH